MKSSSKQGYPQPRQVTEQTTQKRPMGQSKMVYCRWPSSVPFMEVQLQFIKKTVKEPHDDFMTPSDIRLSYTSVPYASV